MQHPKEANKEEEKRQHPNDSYLGKSVRWL
jgi:hypothetical protein